MRKAVLYARVSTEKQSDEGTIKSQIEKLREISSKDNIAKEYFDDGWSGGSLVRPALDELRDDARDGKFEVVYILDPDRLSRVYAHQILVIDELKKLGIEIKFANREYKDNPEDKLLFSVQGVIAEYEKAKILERTRRGKTYKAKRGIVVGTEAPYGYTYIKKSDQRQGYYRINPEEKRIVEIIFDTYLECKTINGLIVELHKRKIKTRNGRDYWEKSTLGRLLRNETYIGTTYYNKNKSIYKEDGKKYKKKLNSYRVFRKKDEWIPIKVPTIIPNEIFQRVQAILEFNKKNVRPAKRKYLLTGLVECGNCSSRYTGDATRQYRYYRCNSRQKRNTYTEKCNNGLIKAPKLEDAVWNKLSKLLNNPELIKKHIINNAKQYKSEENKIKEKLENINTILKQKNESKQRILNAYSNGKINEEEFNNTIDSINLDMSTLENEQKDLELKINTINKEPEKIKDTEDFCELISDKLKTISFNGKKEILNLVCEKIVLKGKTTAEVHTIIPPVEGIKSFQSNKKFGALSPIE